MREYADGEVVQHEHRTSVMTLMYGSWLKCDPGTVHVAVGVDEKAIHTERTRLIVCCNVSSLWTRFQKACHSIRESTACEIEVDSADSNDGGRQYLPDPRGTPTQPPLPKGVMRAPHSLTQNLRVQCSTLHNIWCVASLIEVARNYISKEMFKIDFLILPSNT